LTARRGQPRNPSDHSRRRRARLAIRRNARPQRAERRDREKGVAGQSGGRIWQVIVKSFPCRPHRYRAYGNSFPREERKPFRHPDSAQRGASLSLLGLPNALLVSSWCGFPERRSVPALASRRLLASSVGQIRHMAEGDVHVLRGNTGWRVMIEGRARPQSMHDTQRRARETVRAIARRSGREVLVHGRDGQIRERDRYGNASASG
jgi:hypothetical protein